MIDERRIADGEALVKALVLEAAAHHVRSDAHDILQYEAARVRAAIEGLRGGGGTERGASTLLGAWGQSIHHQIQTSLLARVRDFWEAEGERDGQGTTPTESVGEK